MLRKFVVLIILSFIVSGLNAQSLFTINEPADFIEIDQQQNVYLVKGAVLKKFSKEGKLLFSYSDKINGLITQIDVTNPLRVLVFMEQSNKLVYLNQQLTPIGDVVDVYNSLGLEISALGISSKNGFWAFNYDRQSVVCVNNAWQVIAETPNLIEWLQNDKVLFIREINQNVYIALNEKVLVFDSFGSYLTTIHFKDCSKFSVSGTQFTYEKNKAIFVYNINTRVEQLVNTKNVQDIFNDLKVSSTRIYELTKAKVLIYER